jgi:hypothetical protein
MMARVEISGYKEAESQKKEIDMAFAKLLEREGE